MSTQVEDVRYLVEVVWAFRSARQDSSDLDGLMFARWDRGMDWSPWNCILLSKEEASGHKEVEDIHKVHLCHVITSHEYLLFNAEKKVQILIWLNLAGTNFYLAKNENES